MIAELDALIGSRMQQARRALGFKSARSFARKHNIPESTYSQHETGKRSLNPTTLTIYCEYLKITPGSLISGHQKNNTLEENFAQLKLILQTELSSFVQPDAQLHFNLALDACIESYKTQNLSD